MDETASNRNAGHLKIKSHRSLICPTNIAQTHCATDTCEHFMLTFTIHMLSKPHQQVASLSACDPSVFGVPLRMCMETTQRAAATAKYQAFSTRYTQPLPTQNHLIRWHSKSVCCRHPLCSDTNCVRFKFLLSGAISK